MIDMNAVALLLIGLGGSVMAVNIWKYKTLINPAEEFFSLEKQKIGMLYKIHSLLMWFFLIGYFVVFLGIALKLHFLGNISVGVIFFFGAFFVSLGILLQSSMLLSIRRSHDDLVKKNQQLLQTENVTILALAYLAEMRDHETGAHLERTSCYVRLLGNELRKSGQYADYVSPEYIDDIVKAAPLHDIGKVGIPDAILRKPGKLTREEFEIIKNHCDYGANILEMAEAKLEFQSFLRVAVKIVRSHHEKWDGSGYPDGLRNDEIPLSARIMSLADVYDALRSERCYKKAFSHEEACTIIAEGKGTHFSPDIVEAFMRSERQFRSVSTKLAD